MKELLSNVGAGGASPAAGGAAPAAAAGGAADAPKEEEKKEEEKVCLVDVLMYVDGMLMRFCRRSLTTTWASVCSTKTCIVSKIRTLRITSTRLPRCFAVCCNDDILLRPEDYRAMRCDVLICRASVSAGRPGFTESDCPMPFNLP